MSKRSCPFTDIQQAVKKQELCYGSKGRVIRSTLSEKALQLLFLGAAKQVVNSKTEKDKFVNVTAAMCSICQKAVESEIKCFYCDTFICCDCAESCTRCAQDYCEKCVFILEDKGYSICYSCY